MEDIPPHTAEEARRTRAAAADHTAEEAASFKGRIASITKFYYGYSQKRLLLSIVLKTVAEFHANILTIHQSIPINGIASLTLSVDVLPETGDVTQMVARIEEQTGIHYVKILGRE